MGQADGRTNDGIVTLPSDVSMEARPAAAQKKPGDNAAAGPSGSGRGGLNTNPINGRPPEAILKDKGGVFFEAEATAISIDGEGKGGDEDEMESEALDRSWGSISGEAI